MAKIFQMEGHFPNRNHFGSGVYFPARPLNDCKKARKQNSATESLANANLKNKSDKTGIHTECGNLWGTPTDFCTFPQNGPKHFHFPGFLMPQNSQKMPN